MTSSQDMRAVVDELLQKSRSLRKAAHAIAAAYDIKIFKRSVQPGPNHNGETLAINLSRPEQLKRFLEKHGPSRRADILKATKIPLGTIGALLSENCQRDDEGLWSWKGGDPSL
jgi:hypothetical protein